MKCLVVCVDALDPRIVEEMGLFRKLRGQRGKTWTDTARNGGLVASAKAWTSLYTGMSEKELADTGLAFNQDRNKADRSNTVGDLEVDTIWKKLSDRGYKTGVLDALVTDTESMPKKEGNFILTGIDRARSWYPEDLDVIVPVPRLQTAIPYPVPFKTILGRDVDWDDIDPKELEAKMPDYYFGMSEFIKIRNSYFTPAIRSLKEKYDPDFLLVFRYEIDHLSHMNWHEPGKKTVKRGYEYIEEFVYELNDMLQPEHILIVSDHGMGELHSTYDKHYTINGVPVDRAVGCADVIVSCEHEGAGFYLLSGVEEKYREVNMSDISKIIEGLYK